MKLTLAYAVAVATLLLSATACGMDPAAPTLYSAFTQADVRPGTGATAVSGNSITVDYTGWLYDPAAPDRKGAQFDTSTGRAPFTFTLGAGQVITGWDQGVVGMKEGGVRRLVIPPSLAYGAARHGQIPPDSTLVFDITLISVNTP